MPDTLETLEKLWQASHKEVSTEDGSFAYMLFANGDCVMWDRADAADRDFNVAVRNAFPALAEEIRRLREDAGLTMNGFPNMQLWCRNCEKSVVPTVAGMEIVCSECYFVACTFHPPEVTRDQVIAFLKAKSNKTGYVETSQDTRRMDAIESGAVMVTGSASDPLYQWRARRGDANGFDYKSWHRAPTMRAAIDAAMQGEK